MRPHCILSASRPYRRRLAKLLASKFVPSAQNEADRLLICPRTVQARRRAPSLIGLDVACPETARCTVPMLEVQPVWSTTPPA